MAGEQTQEVPWGVDLRAFVCRIVLAVVGGLAVWPLIFAALGHQVTTISSGSMEPGIRTGDVVASRSVPFDDVPVGAIVTLANPASDGGSLLTHRVVERTPAGELITKGDANADRDSTPVPSRDVWLGVLRVPWVGLPVVWAQHSQWHLLAALAITFALLARGAVATPLVPRGNGDGAQPAGRRLAPAAAATVATMVVVAVVVSNATSSSAAFTAQTVAGSSSWQTKAATASLGPYGDLVVADGAFLYQRMNETSGTIAYDSTGHGLNSNYVGTIGQTLTGVFPGQLGAQNYGNWFDGAGAVASNRVYTDTADFTIEMWVRADSWEQNQGTSVVAELRTPTGFRDRFFFRWGNLYYQADENASELAVQFYRQTDGQWHYFAVAMQGTHLRISIDGATAWWADVPGRVTTGPARFVVGTGMQPYDDPTALGVDGYRGGIDELALYRVALTDAQRLAHYNAATPR